MDDAKRRVDRTLALMGREDPVPAVEALFGSSE
jgi:hypothetical protein